MFEQISINELDKKITCEFDLFICFNSFEERCMSIAQYIPKDKFHNYLIYTNITSLENEEENLNKLKEIFCNNVDIIYVDFAAPIGVADKIIESLYCIDSKQKLKRIFLDITTFTHEALLIILAILNEKYKDTEIICGYNNAKEYSFDNSETETKWLSRGIGDVRSVLGYSGNMKPSQDNLLMIITGYEYERAARIVDAITPEYLSIGYNKEINATTEKNKNANESYLSLLKDISPYFDHMVEFEIPSNNPYGTYEAICNMLNNIDKNINIKIVAMNNKLSTVGVALVGLTIPDVQLCYAPALVYNTSAYSLPGEQCYIFSFDIPKKAEL